MQELGGIRVIIIWKKRLFLSGPKLGIKHACPTSPSHLPSSKNKTLTVIRPGQGLKYV